MDRDKERLLGQGPGLGDGVESINDSVASSGAGDAHGAGRYGSGGGSGGGSSEEAALLDGVGDLGVHATNTAEGDLVRGSQEHRYSRRNWIAYWILGLTNNFGYVIMLSGAHDILKKLDPSLGTGAVLLADILPTLFIKVTGPMFLFHFSYSTRVVTCICAALLSFLLVAFSTTVAMALSGVVFASVSAGLGEITFLSMTACYHKSVISAWSSGTGGAGVVGALAYLGLTEVVSPSNTQLIMTCIPALMAASYFAMLTHRPRSLVSASTGSADPFTFKEKLAMTRRLVVPFMLPLFFVYWSEYMINQGLFENMLWPHAHISTDAQYRLYQTLYQVGVFLSRSSLAVFALRGVWIPALVQIANFAALFVEARVHFLPGIWLTYIWIIFEGLLGGLVYVNAFALISKRTAPDRREFSMSIASVADSCGIALAGACSLAINAYLRHHNRT